jgi:hypothetical protein
MEKRAVVLFLSLLTPNDDWVYTIQGYHGTSGGIKGHHHQTPNSRTT